MKSVELFGGAMRTTVPADMEDVSRFRQVPDYQEVYTDSATGATLIVELLSRNRTVPNEQAASFFFFDLAKDNGCTGEQVKLEQIVAPLPDSTHPHLLQLPAERQGTGKDASIHASLARGVQLISKYTNETGRENEVAVQLAVLRLPPPISTELLVSLSAVSKLHPASSEAKTVQRLLSAEERDGVMARALQDLQVIDWGLFVPEEE